MMSIKVRRFSHGTDNADKGAHHPDNGTVSSLERETLRAHLSAVAAGRLAIAVAMRVAWRLLLVVVAIAAHALEVGVSLLRVPRTVGLAPAGLERHKPILVLRVFEDHSHRGVPGSLAP